MKNLKLKLRGLALAAALVLSLSSAFAGGNVKINPYLNTDYSIVSVFNTSNSNLKLKVYDENGYVFYSETVEAESNTQKLFDLSYLSDGNYTLVLVGKNTRVEETFQVAGKKLLVTNELMQLAENKNKSSQYAFEK
ncbi:hypothetical protein DWB61_09065 [Ancylomarina euxinus]|uniref:T9SS C-terminal target domain-containing protein n=1 Tax=Ancylomarina euxinus TaxID=2283627 RepID=A0A425Y217_9BACT|nr:FimB/Mfa2 family fimbrial subunit [Ancylomarina euxinus]MCZ4695062.1 FimB/Mfa2 family fimbrial subunit [Ancylomarina euxinus]MUP15002.1 hypothetical protein [Ancylomarina euxinus]RRG21891.1 hypothetical protein DWB61_09065 [Ancylomarina euxinus]